MQVILNYKFLPVIYYYGYARESHCNYNIIYVCHESRNWCILHACIIIIMQPCQFIELLLWRKQKWGSIPLNKHTRFFGRWIFMAVVVVGGGITIKRLKANWASGVSELDVQMSCGLNFHKDRRHRGQLFHSHVERTHWILQCYSSMFLPTLWVCCPSLKNYHLVKIENGWYLHLQNDWPDSLQQVALW